MRTSCLIFRRATKRSPTYARTQGSCTRPSDTTGAPAAMTSPCSANRVSTMPSAGASRVSWSRIDSVTRVAACAGCDSRNHARPVWGRAGGGRGVRLHALELLRRRDPLDREHLGARKVVRGSLAVRFRGADFGGAGRGRVGERAALLDLCRETGLLEDGHRVPCADGIAFVFEQPLQATGSERAEPHLADLDRAGDGQRIPGVMTRRREERGRAEG